QDGAAYQLCATFALASDAASKDTYGNMYGPNWSHPAGTYCFSIDSAKRATDNSGGPVPKGGIVPIPAPVRPDGNTAPAQ
ncbi:MAG: hypothetical protein RLZZ324_65, partial [Candidatus Parcubacteria bacterium]